MKKGINRIIYITAIIVTVVLVINFMKASQNGELDKEDQMVAYDDLLDQTLHHLNEYPYIQADANEVNLYQHRSGQFSLSSLNRQNSTTVKTHEKTDEDLEEYYDLEESYRLDDQIEGEIGKNKSLQTMAFIQTNEQDQAYQMEVTTLDITKLADLKAALNKLDIEDENYEAADLEALFNVTFSNMDVPNLNTLKEDLNLRLDAFSPYYYDDYASFSISFTLKKFFHKMGVYLTIYPQSIPIDEKGDLKETPDGKKVWVEKDKLTSYKWEGDHYNYKIEIEGFFYINTENDIFKIIDQTNTPFKK